MSKQAKPATVIFRDKAYKSRTIVLPGGRTFDVVKRQIETDDAELIDYLDAHPEFERLPAEG